jgi:hypothetical protein
VNLEIQQGKVITIMGASGQGSPPFEPEEVTRKIREWQEKAVYRNGYPYLHAISSGGFPETKLGSRAIADDASVHQSIWLDGEIE